VIRSCACPGARDPDRHVDPVRDARRQGDHGALGPAADPLGDDGGSRLVDGRQHDRELLAAVARCDVAFAQARAEDAGEDAECLVAGRMPVSVVEVLEMIEVDHQHRD